MESVRQLIYFQLDEETKRFATRTLNIFGVGCGGCSRKRQAVPAEEEWGSCNYEGITHSACPFDYRNNVLGRPGPEWVEVAA